MNWKTFFYFSRKEMKATLILFLFLILCWLIPYLFIKQDTSIQLGLVNTMKDSLEKGDRQKFGNPAFTENNGEKPEIKINYFNFNPNKIDSLTWLSLGFNPRQIKTILKYLHKGGHFYKPLDLYKIYNLPKKLVDDLQPFIIIETATEKNTFKRQEYDKYQKNTQEPEPSPISKKININTCSAYELIRQTKMPKELIYKILNFRKHLGGFVHLKQIADTYTITDSLYNEFIQFVYLEPIVLPAIFFDSAKPAHFTSLHIIDKKDAYKIIKLRQQIGSKETWDFLLNSQQYNRAQVDSIKKYFYR